MPVLGTDHRNGKRAGLIVFGRDRPAHARRHAQHAVIVACRDERSRDLRLSVNGGAHAAERRAGEQIRHRPVVGNELLEHGV